MLKDCDDVVAVNIRKKLGGRVGDIQFIKKGAPAITFAGVKDPYSLVEMANAANEKVLAIIREAEKRHAARPEGTGSTCSRYNSENPPTAKFCNQCGSSI